MLKSLLQNKNSGSKGRKKFDPTLREAINLKVLI